MGKLHVGGRMLLVGIGALAAIGVLAGVLVARNRNQAATTDAGAQVASVQTACQQWLGARATPSPPGGSSWCTDMARWMASEMNQHAESASQVWGDPSHMLATCDRWMVASPSPGGATGDPQTTCRSLVDWMSAHMASWSGWTSWEDWMRHGPGMHGPGMGG